MELMSRLLTFCRRFSRGKECRQASQSKEEGASAPTRQTPASTKDVRDRSSMFKDVKLYAALSIERAHVEALRPGARARAGTSDAAETSRLDDALGRFFAWQACGGQILQGRVALADACSHTLIVY